MASIITLSNPIFSYSGDMNLDDDEWEARFFRLINELSKKHTARYEIQTNELLKKHVLRVEFDQALIDFKITLRGLSFRTNDTKSHRNTNSWVRMGWRKSTKRKELPFYFAEAEATIIMNRLE